MTKPTVAEIVTLRLKPGVSDSAFTEAAQAMTPFLKSTGALISRALSADGDGMWTDHILWTSEDAAKTAAAEMFTRPEAAAFMGMIDTSDTHMRHAGLMLYLPPE